MNKGVQGQTAAQPEGAFFNLVNWVGNVIAALCVVMAIVSYMHGRGVARWVVAAAGLNDRDSPFTFAILENVLDYGDDFCARALIAHVLHVYHYGHGLILLNWPRYPGLTAVQCLQ